MTIDDDQSPTLRPYYAALNRLLSGNSTIVPKGTKISLNAVALEAGKSAGSIKKSRSVYAKLIEEIDIRAREQRNASAPGELRVKDAKEKASKAKASSSHYETLYKAALARELMLLVQLDKLEEKIRKINNVVPIRKNN